MGKKGSKRKTRWRTLSIGAPPGEEDEEEGLRKEYGKNQDKEANAHTVDRNGQSGCKPWRFGTGTSGSTSGYASSGSRSHRDESSGSPSQPKIIFNEDEYTRITTPRQDVLFKKGYLSRKKPWAGNASTSATPSTTESQSASHSTADGSETTEDQQLLDRDSGTGEYPPMVEPGAQLGYGTFYDHASGYYYEYPVMLVGPAPVPAQVGPSVLAAVPCGPVPLRPIEWINPAFVPKLANQPYCLMDYQTSQSTETATIVEEHNGTVITEVPNGMWNESGTGSASCSGSVAEEIEEQTEEMDSATAIEQRPKEQHAEEQQHLEQHHQHHEHLEEQQQQQQHLENGSVTTAVDPYLDPLMLQEPPPIHVSHVVPAVPQPYMYPGHYMFGPPLVNVNGVTIQGGPLVRTMDIAAMTMACAKRRKKRKKRKQKRPTLGNTEDEEEGEYSSECDNDLSSSRLPWSECPTTTTITTTTTAANPRPLNPECQEFQLRPALQSRVPSSPVSTSTMVEKATTSANDAAGISSATVAETVAASLSREPDEVYDISSAQSPTNPEDASTTIHDDAKQLVAEQTPSENVPQLAISVGHKPRNRKGEVNGRVDSIENTKAATTSENLFAEAKSGSVPIDVIDGAALSGRTDTVENGNDSAMADVVQHDLLKGNDNSVSTELLNNHVECKKVEGALTNGEVGFKHLGEPTEQVNVSKSRSVSPQVDDALTDKSRPDPTVSNAKATTTNVNAPEEEETYQGSRHCNNLSVARTTTPSLAQPRKYSKKSSKFVREPTPGPDLDDQTMRSDVENGKFVRQLDRLELSYDTRAAHAELDHVTDTNNVLGRTDRETPHEQDFGNDDNKTKTTTSQDTIEGSNEDSGFESQTRLPKYPITAAVTEWLRRANSPDTLFLTSASTSDSDTDEEDDDDEEMNGKPPKNLQGNPMPALSANSGVDNSVTTTLSRTASCGEFAKSNNNNINNISMIDRVETHGTSVIGRRKKDTVGAARRKTAATKRIDKRNNRKVDDKTQKQSVSSLVSCHRLENVVGAAKLKDPSKSNVGNICEFTQEDSVAGMRVALNSRMNSKRVSARRAKTSRRIKRDPVENIDIRMRRIDDAQNGQSGGETQDNSVSVRTFERGEIIVSSEDGKLLPTSSYEPVPSDDRNTLEVTTKTSAAARAVDVINENMQETCEEETRHSSENDENLMMSSVSIEEPDVLECWEAETIEPVITPKRMLQTPGVLCEGEAVEDDNFEVEKATVEHVRKYYRLDSAISIEEESSEVSTRSVVSVPKSRTVPNNPERMIERLYGVEEIPIVMPDKSRDIILGDEQTPVDEAFEVYESCYIDEQSPFPTPFNSRVFKQQRPLLQDGEGPIPCRAVCCNIQ